jgi:FtsP/CotA-like multicopper oxidase with cupredoxin domain
MFLAFEGFAFSADALPTIVPNQNHSPAGVLRDGVLTVGMEIAKGEWYPEADNGMALSVYAFGEAGGVLQNPGPLLRVPQGTEIRVSVHNTLAVPITVHGLGDSGAGDASLHIAPGATEHARFKAMTAGLFCYWGATEVEDLKLRHGIDSELTGAFVVDPAGAIPNDEIFVMELMSERPGANARQNLATINGKSWPYTRRFQYDVGQPVRWRWINATNEPHALHLHGFYFRIDAFSRSGRVETYNGESRPRVVTQRIAQGETFDMSWSPDRPGRWLFHCHMLIHMIPPTVPSVPGLSVRPSLEPGNEHAEMHDTAGMGQLVLGITVPETGKATTSAAWHADRKLQLEISERDGAPRYALQLRDNAPGAVAPGKPGLIGPPIVLARDEPVEIEVINQLTQPTAIHWHGIELESYYDGVPGWTGAGTQTTPPIAPGTSFVARMTPPRAGTFIYHTHWHDELQLTNGIYGPLIVLPPGEKFDPTSDLTFVFSMGDFGALEQLALINGTPQSKALRLQLGKKYRFRLINISTNNQGMQVSLRNPTGPVDWRIIAKDGANLPPDLARMSKAQLTITVGETYDVEFSTATAQELLLDLTRPALKMHTVQSLLFAPAGQADLP